MSKEVSTHIKKDEQINDIAELIANGFPKFKIKEIFTKKWGGSESNFNILFLDSKKQLHKDAKKHRMEELGKTLRRLYTIHNRAMASNQLSIALGVNNTIIGLLNLNRLVSDDENDVENGAVKLKLQEVLDAITCGEGKEDREGILSRAPDIITSKICSK